MNDLTIKKILIVDDEEAILFAFSKVLMKHDLQIHTASSLNDAWNLMKKNEYQAVIADLRLSGTGNNEGFDVIRFVKTNQKNCKIVVMTAFGDENTKAKAFSLGIDHYLEKPISPYKLKEFLERTEI